MPRRRILSIQRAKAPKSVRETFQHRYAGMEARRLELATRLAALGAVAKRCPAYNTAFTLLNKTFRKERLARRAAILQSASWMLDVLEQMTMAL